MQRLSWVAAGALAIAAVLGFRAVSSERPPVAPVAPAADAAPAAPSTEGTLAVGERRALLVPGVDQAFVVPADAVDVARLGRNTLVLTARRPGAAELRVLSAGREWSLPLSVGPAAAESEEAPAATASAAPPAEPSAAFAAPSPALAPAEDAPPWPPAAGIILRTNDDAPVLAEGDFLPRDAGEAARLVVPIPPARASVIQPPVPGAVPLLALRPPPASQLASSHDARHSVAVVGASKPARAPRAARPSTRRTAVHPQQAPPPWNPQPRRRPAEDDETPPTLTGILRTETGPVALLDGREVGEGDRLETFTVEQVDVDRVVLLDGSGRSLTLRLASR